MWLRRCEECTSGALGAPLVSFVYGDRHVRCAQAQELINTTDSPVEIKSIDIKQEDTKTGGMFLNKASEVEIIQASPHCQMILKGAKEMQIFFSPSMRLR